MENETIKKNNDNTAVRPAAPAMAPRPDMRQPMQGGRDMRKNSRRSPRRESRVKPEFDQKIIDIRRVTRVVTGGRRFSFSVALVAGNKKGSVGVGIGKAGDTSLAIDKAMRNAKKGMIKINLNKDMSIPHEIKAKFCSSRVLIMPAPGKGILAGSSVRNVLELAGIKGTSAKLLSGSKNKLNNAKAAIKALSMLKVPKVKAEEKTDLSKPVSAEVSSEAK